MLPVLLLAVGLLACRPVVAQRQWRYLQPTSAHQAASFADPLLTESSGVAVSRRYPGLIWTHNDSGSEPWIFASDTLGRSRGRFRVAGAVNIDWEDIALGPCPAGSCLYLADTGDNDEVRSSITIYRLPEPRPPTQPTSATGITAPAQSLEVRLPSGPHDVEALFVTPGGDSYLVTKGRRGKVLLFRVARSAWGGDPVVPAEALGPLPIAPDPMIGRWVTGAALSPDGRQVAVRTYREVFLFRLRADGGLDPGPSPTACLVLDLGWQGEGVGWLDRRVLVLTSEGGPGGRSTVAVARCPGEP